VALFAQPDPIQQMQNALDEIGLPARNLFGEIELSTPMFSRIVQQSQPTAFWTQKAVGSIKRAERSYQQYFQLP